MINIFYKDCCDKFIDYVKKSYNEQDLERVADTSKTLTEQWKKGKLKDGYYFFKTKDNIKIGFLYERFKYPYDGRYNTINDVVEVLCDVPTYEEHCIERKLIMELSEENTKLKELLKEQEV